MQNDCYHNKFILNGEITLCKSFHNKYLKNGTSIFEVVRIIDSKALFYSEHIDRLIKTAEITNIKICTDKNEIFQLIKELLNANEVFNGNVKLVFNKEDDKALCDNNVLMF